MLGELGDHQGPALRVVPAAEVGVLRAIGAGRRARVVDPHRVREVVQGDERADAGGDQSVDQRVVVGQRVLVDLVALRLDAGPLDREAVAVEVHRRQQGDVGEREAVAAGGVADEGALAEAVGRRGGPQVPVDALVLVLDLGRGAGDPEAEAAGPAGPGDRADRRELLRLAAGRRVAGGPGLAAAAAAGLARRTAGSTRGEEDDGQERARERTAGHDAPLVTRRACQRASPELAAAAAS